MALSLHSVEHFINLKEPILHTKGPFIKIGLYQCGRHLLKCYLTEKGAGYIDGEDFSKVTGEPAVNTGNYVCVESPVIPADTIKVGCRPALLKL